MAKNIRIITGLILTIAVIAVASFYLQKIKTNPSDYIPPTHRSLPTTTIFLAGDVMLSRNVATKIYESNQIDLPFASVTDKISKADIAFANLESPFSDKGKHNNQGLVFSADPLSVEGLKIAGFDVMSTANNHAFDQGLYGLNFTYNHLQAHGIIPVGSTPACHDGVTIQKNNLTFGFLAYSYAAINDGGKIANPNICDWNDVEQIEKDVRLLKQKADFVIVSGQYGIEYKRVPTAADVKTAHLAIDAGADILIGHHPHWIQTTEQYQGKWIFYSLGNFVFDQMWSTDTREGLALNIIFKENILDQIELLPVIIENYCCPRWAMSIEAAEILKKINPEAQSNFVLKNGIVSPDWINHTNASNLTNP